VKTKFTVQSRIVLDTLQATRAMAALAVGAEALRLGVEASPVMTMLVMGDAQERMMQGGWLEDE
jgi:hypothetical protein